MNTVIDRQKAAINFVCRRPWQNPTAVTLTCKVALENDGKFVGADPLACEKNLKHFLNVLNNKCKRRKNPLQAFSVLEQHTLGRYHFHLCIERPDEMTFEAFQMLIKDAWSRTHWGAKQTDVRSVFDVHGWIGYICKRRSKGGLWDENIDWNNSYLRNV